jgi:predicted PurR-regulated permease PerM
VQTLGFTLRWWLIGRLMDMTLVGVLSGVGLWLLGIPLALSLGILAGLLNFIPNIGPLLAAVPAVLLALTEGAPQALYVIILYMGIQSLESYLVVPLIQKKLISMPPVLIFIAQLSMALMFGVLGLLLATPMAAVLLVLVKMIYIEDILGEEIDVDGEPEA